VIISFERARAQRGFNLPPTEQESLEVRVGGLVTEMHNAAGHGRTGYDPVRMLGRAEKLVLLLRELSATED
jgi:hypothetical protein